MMRVLSSNECITIGVLGIMLTLSTCTMHQIKVDGNVDRTAIEQGCSQQMAGVHKLWKCGENDE